jgi:hypothetical protein
LRLSLAFGLRRITSVCQEVDFRGFTAAAGGVNQEELSGYLDAAADE